MIAYLDTSALLKLILDDEPGAVEARAITSAVDGVLTNRIAYPEGRAAIAAAQRARRIDGRKHVLARSSLDRLFGRLEVVEVNPTLAYAAGELAERLALKGADALHLASALGASSAEGVLFVTWDRQLARAGAKAGLDVAPA